MKTWEFLLMILIFVGIGQITNHYFFDSENYPEFLKNFSPLFRGVLFVVVPVGLVYTIKSLIDDFRKRKQAPGNRTPL